MSVFIRLAAIAALCAALLCAPMAHGQDRPEATYQADAAIWGLYARLADTTRQDPDGYAIRWHWVQPGQELVEEYFTPSNGKVAYTANITPGTSPGTLHLKGSALGGKEWNGTLQPDGSVVYIGTGLLKLHFQAVLASDGAYEAKPIKVRDGAVVSVAGRTVRYVLADGSAAVATAAAPSAAAHNASPSSTLASAAGTRPDAGRAAASATASPPSFGWLDTLAGRSFVGTSPDGGPFNLTVSREGIALVLTMGNARLAFRPGSLPGRFELIEAWHGGSINDKAIAYIAGSGGAPTRDSLDGYYSDPREPGDLVVGYDISGGYISLVFHQNSNGGFTYYQNGGDRTFGIRRAMGNSNYSDVRWFTPATQQAIDDARAFAAGRQRQYEEQQRQDAELDAYIEAERQQRAVAWEQQRAASEQGLADSIARLNGTVASVEAQQAQYRAQQQSAELAAASAKRQSEIDNARAATEQAENQAAHYAQQRKEEQQRASTTAQGASLTVSDTNRAKVSAPATGQATPKQVLGFCSGLTLGGFERDNEAVVYVSSIGPVDYAFGQPLEPLKQAYAAKLGIPGLIPDCLVSTDRAVLERKRQEAIDNRGYPNAKRVMTSL